MPDRNARNGRSSTGPCTLRSGPCKAPDLLEIKQTLSLYCSFRRLQEALWGFWFADRHVELLCVPQAYQIYEPQDTDRHWLASSSRRQEDTLGDEAYSLQCIMPQKLPRPVAFSAAGCALNLSVAQLQLITVCSQLDGLTCSALLWKSGPALKLVVLGMKSSCQVMT